MSLLMFNMSLLCCIFPSTSGAAKNENGLRGATAGRKLHYDEPALCNSIGCPDGFQPILDAMNVECHYDVCGVEQCCQTFCSSFPCPGGYIPIEDASSIPCNDQDCTREQCCDVHH